MKVIHISGTPEEMAGSLYSQIEHRETLEYFLDFPKRVLGGVVGNGAAGRVGLYALKKLTGLIAGKYNKDDLRFWKRYCEMLGIDYGLASRSLAYPDMLLYLVGRSGLFIRGIPQVNLGCSSLAVRKGDGIVHGRNLDFYGGRYWTRDHALIVSQPAGKLGSITATADGLHLPGLTSINEAGIAISLHVLFTRKVSFYGEPALSIVSEIMSTCENVEDVRKLLDNRKTSSGWGFLITDGKTGECSVFEANSVGTSELKVTDNKFSYANMALTQKMKSDEFVPAYLWVQNNYYRKGRMDDLLKSSWFGVDHIKMFKILGDMYDPGMKKDMLAGNTISNSYTISSATFSFSEDRMAVADGSAPAPLGDLYEYSISDLFHGKKEPLKVYKKDVKRSEALETYTLAGCEYSETHNFSELVSIMSGLKVQKPDEYAFSLFLSVAYAKLGEYGKALEYADETLTYKLDHYREGAVLLLKGLYRDLLGDRADALVMYERVLKNYRYPCLTEKSLKYFSKPCGKKQIDRLELNWFMSFVLIF